MKIGILGGTFNPIHIGHLILAENAFDFAGLDQVLFIPSGISYLKDQAEIISASERIRMVQLAIEGNDHFALSTIETDRSGNSYTYETLETLKDAHPMDELFFIGGADILMTIHTWKEPERIFQSAILVIAPRDHKERQQLEEQKLFLERKYDASVKIMDTINLEISSSMLRERIKNGFSIRYYVPASVDRYIREKQFYKGEDHAE
ncbi:MAG: nicotinate-nucleotide adenylyltransferase [Lachnospiraceae bacterium]|nr:nicotinate-nucleotide adenylyltransferase [Lachnospiraceae bacterium]